MAVKKVVQAVVLCLSLLADGVFTYFFVTTAELRKSPGQLILAQTQAQIILNLLWLLVLCVWLGKDSTLCYVLDALCSFFFILACCYMAVICLAMGQDREVLLVSWLRRYHIAALVSAACISLVMGLIGGLQASIFPYDCLEHSGGNMGG